jgi:CRP/FNR family transcriptional regulator
MPASTVEGAIVSVALKRNIRPVAALPSISCHRREARDQTFGAGVEPEKQHRLDAISTKIDLEPRQNVFFEGDPAGFAFNVTRGMVKASKALPDGRRQITGFLYPGDFLGIALHNAYVYSAEALTCVTLCRFPRPKLRALFDEFPKLEIHLLSLTANELAAAQDQLLLLGRKSAREKVASFLLMLVQRAEPGGKTERLLHLPMTRLDIADYLGLSAETVSRTFSTFRGAGLIDYDLPTPVILQQPELLEVIAEGDTRQLFNHANASACG